MSVSTTYTVEELDVLEVLEVLAFLERAGGKSPTSSMQGRIVRERLAHVMRADPDVRRLVAQRRDRRAAASNQGRLRLIQGGAT